MKMPIFQLDLASYQGGFLHFRIQAMLYNMRFTLPLEGHMDKASFSAAKNTGYLPYRAKRGARSRIERV